MTRPRKCKECGCTDDDCRGCIERTGIPCSWSDIEPDLCTACEELGPPENKPVCGKPARHGPPCNLDVGHIERGERHSNGDFTWALRGKEARS